MYNYYYPYQYAPQQTQQQIGFVRVQSENEARMFPVAAGQSVTFIDETQPYCYVKTVDMSQLDRPKFDKYRLVKEEVDNSMHKAENAPNYALQRDVEALATRLEELRAEIDGLTIKKTSKRKEADDE